MKTRTQLHKDYNKTIQQLWNTYHIQPSILIEYLYMNQENTQEATQMLRLEVQRALIYYNTLTYNNYTDTVEQTIQDIKQQLK